jgi:hypothetical protein
MPNWCHDTLIVSGDPAQLWRFVEAVKESDEEPLSFAKHLPPPNGVDGYDWRTQNWGTKWDAQFSEPLVALGIARMDVKASVAANGREADDGHARYTFDTAWSPPIQWLDHVALLYSDLRFVLEFGEPGNDFAGRLTYEGGHCVTDEALEISDVLDEARTWF